MDPSLLQRYLQLDEEFSAVISSFYAKHCSESLELIGSDGHHSCIVSDESREYALLMNQKTQAQDTWLSNVKQKLLAEAAKAKYDQALKTFENQMRREAQDRFLADAVLQGYAKELKSQLGEVGSRIQKLLEEEIPRKMREIGEVNADVSSFDGEQTENEWAFAYFSGLMSTLSSLLQKQRVTPTQQRNLLATCLILAEQELIQKEYDQVHALQVRLEDWRNQVDFRIEKYQQLRLRADLLYSEKRTTIDSRETELMGVAALVGAEEGENRLAEVIRRCVEAKESINKSQMLHRKVIDSALESLSNR